MTDNRVRVETTKQIDLAELDAELGNHGLVSDGTCVIAIEGSPTTQEQLQAAVDEYDPNRVARREAEQLRAIAYIAESDPLFFEWQRGEGTEQAWRDKVEEIRQRYPYPT